MKKLLLIAWALFISMSLFALNLEPEYIPIIPNPDKPNPPKGDTTPLSLNRADIEATYFMGAITFVFNEDLGDCDIEVLNINTGEVWNASHSGVGSAIVYTSDSHGTYYIYIDTDCGGYSGEYTN